MTFFRKLIERKEITVIEKEVFDTYNIFLILPFAKFFTAPKFTSDLRYLTILVANQ